jgi:hypothetical protein
MTTKSLTQGKPARTRAELNAYTGKGGDADDHPLITCTPHILGGHAHLKANKTTVERVFLAEAQRIEGPLRMSSGLVLTEDERRACLMYAVALFEILPKLHAQVAQLQEIVHRQEKRA